MYIKNYIQNKQNKYGNQNWQPKLT